MTPRAWANALLLAGIFWASLWLILAPKVGGVEAWHDSALPASAFVAIQPSVSKGDSNGAVRQRSDGGARGDDPRSSQRGAGSGNPSDQGVGGVPLGAYRLARGASGSVLSVAGLRSGARSAGRNGVPASANQGVLLTGLASWWDIGSGIYAALPGYVAGTHVSVRVCSGGRCVGGIPVVTSCQCYVGTPGARVIDLSEDLFAKFADPSVGLLEVEVYP